MTQSFEREAGALPVHGVSLVNGGLGRSSYASLAAAAPALEVRLLGGFEVLVEGQLVDEACWGRRSAKAVVQLLALSPAHALHREQLADLLWPNLEPQAASNSLDKAVHAARRALEPGLRKGGASRFILVSRNQVVLSSPGDLQVDVQRFSDAATEAIQGPDLAAARRALEHYRGPLTVRGLPAYWAVERRDALQQHFRAVVMGAADALTRGGDLAAAVSLLDRLLRDNPDDEPVQRLLSRIQADAGPARDAPPPAAHRRPSRRVADPTSGPQVQARPPTMLATSASVPSVKAWLPHIEPLSFQNGEIRAARVGPGGEALWLSARWSRPEFCLYRLAMAPGRSMPTEQTIAETSVELFACSDQGELALGRRARFYNSFNLAATLAVLPASGGSPIDLLEDVHCADWQPAQPAKPVRATPSAGAGSPAPAASHAWTRLAIVREVSGRTQLEFPIGTVRFETGGWLSSLRFSPDGQRLAFIEHPITMDDEGSVKLIDLRRPGAPVRTLTPNCLSLRGLAWVGEHIWFTASRKGPNRALHRVDLNGVEQMMYQGLGSLTLHDAVPGGVGDVRSDNMRLVVTAERFSFGICARHARDLQEHDISWHERTVPRELSDDGEWLLMEDGGLVGRHPFLAYLRRLDGSGTRLVAPGVPLAMSRDLRHVILRIPSQPSALSLLNLKTGQLRALENYATQGLVHTEYVSFFPDGRRIAFAASDGQGHSRVYLQALAGGPPSCFTPNETGVRMYNNRAVSPLGDRIILKRADDLLWLYDVANGAALRALPLGPEFHLTGWSTDGQHVYVRRWGEPISTVFRHRLIDGQQHEWLILSPAAPEGVQLISSVRLTPDGRSYAYGYIRKTSDLFAFEGPP